MKTELIIDEKVIKELTEFVNENPEKLAKSLEYDEDLDLSPFFRAEGVGDLFESMNSLFQNLPQSIFFDASNDYDGYVSISIPVKLGGSDLYLNVGCVKEKILYRDGLVPFFEDAQAKIKNFLKESSKK